MHAEYGRLRYNILQAIIRCLIAARSHTSRPRRRGGGGGGNRQVE